MTGERETGEKERESQAENGRGPAARPRAGERGGSSPGQTNQARSWGLATLPWPEAGRALARTPRLLFPVGALVQHGPHLPLGTNTFIAQEVAREVSFRTGIALAPAFPYGVRPRARDRFAGTAGLQRKTLHRAMNELLADWEDHGIREFIVLTAHRLETHLDALLMAMTTSSILTVIDLLTIDVTDILTESPLLEHAGELETSLMLHLRPEWVHLDQIGETDAAPPRHRRYARGETATPPASSRGMAGSPIRASAGKGAAVFARYVESLVELLGAEPDVEAHGGPASSGPGPGGTTREGEG